MIYTHALTWAAKAPSVRWMIWICENSIPATLEESQSRTLLFTFSLKREALGGFDDCLR